MTKYDKLYGVHPVLEALDGQRRRIVKVFIDVRRQGALIQRITRLVMQRGIPMVPVESVQLRYMVGHRRHQGVVALVMPVRSRPFAEVVPHLIRVQGHQTIVLLDGVTDVGNFAGLIRSAVAFGVEMLLVPRHRAVSLTPTVAKRSAGALEKISIVQVGNVVRALADLQEAGFWVYGADMKAEVTVGQMHWPERVVVVLGGEERGVRRLVRVHCDGLVRIPMRAGVDSLNVAVAGAIILASIWEHRLERSEGPHRRGSAL